MADKILYVDASALVKLVVEEPESEALRAYLLQRRRRVSSVVAESAVGRAALRVGGDEVERRASEVLGGVNLLELDAPVVELAATLPPASLRTLDAVHVASALSLGSDAGPFVTYDARIQEAATMAGLEVHAPG